MFLVLVLFSLSTKTNAQDQDFTYAYISISERGLSTKLRVDVDLGDTREQIKEGRKYSEILSNKESYAAILNYMTDNQFELVEMLGNMSNSRNIKIIVIMRKRKH